MTPHDVQGPAHTDTPFGRPAVRNAVLRCVAAGGANSVKREFRGIANVQLRLQTVVADQC
jgi:hypothetical protein